MIRYTNYLFIIFMNINEKIGMREKIVENYWGCFYKTTHILAAIYHKLQNMVPDQSLDNYLLSCYLIDKLSYLNIHTY